MSGFDVEPGHGYQDDGSPPPMGRFVPSEPLTPIEKRRRIQDQWEPVRMYVFLLFLLAGGLVVVVVNFSSLVTAAGWAGTSGVLDSVFCQDVGSGRNVHQECRGTFRSGDGGFTVVDVRATGHREWSPNSRYPAQLASDQSSVTVTGSAAVVRLIGFILLGASFVSGAGGSLGFELVKVYRRVRFRTVHFALWQRMVPWEIALVLLLAGAILWGIGFRES